MKKTVLTYGLIGGAIAGGMLLATFPFMDRIGFERGAILGYTTLVASALLIFFGVRSYRDNVARGHLTFGKGVLVGTLIGLVASLCYVAAWEVVYFGFRPDFMARYTAHTLAKAEREGATPEQLETMRQQSAEFAQAYENPAFNAAVTFLEPFPIFLAAALVSAGVLRRRDPAPAG